MICVCGGDSGFGSWVCKNKGFFDRIGIGDRGVTSKEVSLYIDCGNECVKGDVVMCMSVGVVVSDDVVGDNFSGVGERAPGGMTAAAAQLSDLGCFAVGVLWLLLLAVLVVVVVAGEVAVP
jgi:hypothetical protein